jgi:small GTP-binding protein
MSLFKSWKRKREELFDKMEKQTGRKFSRVERDKVDKKLSDILNYQPRIGFFGKTGAGKSSLCNALCGEDACKINDIEACTRDTQELFVEVEKGKGLKLIDVPGVGENSERNDEYAKLYQKLLPDLDTVLWILKGDDRALSVDEAFYKEIVRPHIDQGKPVFFVLNQVDKIEPYRQWDEKNAKPGPDQEQNITLKKNYVQAIFDLKRHQVIAVSANERYGLIELVDAIVEELPRDKKITFVERVNPTTVSEQTRQKARSSMWDVFVEAIEEAGGWVGEKIIEPISDLWDSITIGCFITTAVCEMQAKPDDCYELTQFRKFRDEWLLQQADGERIIQRYYQIAPLILEAINKQSDSKEIFTSINDNYLVPCLKLIEEQRYAECKKLYMRMVEKLENDFSNAKLQGEV